MRASTPDRYAMVPVADALATVLREAAPLAPQSGLLERARGLMLAEGIRASEPLPPFAASVKDGYAVVAADGPGVYPVAGSATAGRGWEFSLRSGQVAYITTGAPLPRGADAVIQVEDTERQDGDGGAQVRLLRAVRPGEDVRPIGYDVAQGEVVVAAGARLGAVEIGLAATAGVAQVMVHPRPRVGVLSTGDELIAMGEPSRYGGIRDSNGPALRAAVAYAGGEAIDLGIVRDDEAALRAAIVDGLAACDLLVTTGGVSMGELDYVKRIAAQVGTVHFGRLLMKPGKPCTFATVEAGDAHAGAKRLLFALPGNPVSSLVTFYLLVLPAIRKMAGWPNPVLPRVHAVLGEPLRLDPVRPEYHRVALSWESALHGGVGGWLAMSTGNQASSRLLSLRGANALLELPRGDGILAEGSIVAALLIAEL